MDEFWSWYHRQVKEPGDRNLTKEEAEELYEEWKDAGKPNAEGKPKDDTIEEVNRFI